MDRESFRKRLRERYRQDRVAPSRPIDPDTLEEVDQRIVRKAKAALRMAFSDALALGPVLIAEHGKLVLVEKDGDRDVVGTLEPQIKMQAGQYRIVGWKEPFHA